jgi:hypothetical protein
MLSLCTFVWIFIYQHTNTTTFRVIMCYKEVTTFLNEVSILAKSFESKLYRIFDFSTNKDLFFFFFGSFSKIRSFPSFHLTFLL